MSIQRAIILIGIQNAASLPPLRAVWDGVRKMEAWAVEQGFKPELVSVITDETREVSPDSIEDVVKGFSERGDIEQLIIYYSGHGINVGFSEYWMLSQAAEDGNEAVNLRASEEAARFGPIPHVVFISDACRSAAVGIASQVTRGASIFPGRFVPGREKSVDIFYATLLGEPALEIRTPEEAAEKYEAVYTSALLEVLQGQHPRVLETDGDHGFVRPRPLKKFLIKHLPLRVFELIGIADGRSQEPDARITSDDDAWLSMVETATIRPRNEGVAFTSPEAIARAEAAEFLAELPQVVTKAAIAGNQPAILESLNKRQNMTAALRHRPDLDVYSAPTERFSRDLETHVESFGPTHFETGCGFKLKGATLSGSVAPIKTEILGNGDLLRVNSPNQAASVLLVLSNGEGVLMPAIAGFIGSLFFENGHLVDVAFEPSENSDRWHMFQNRSDEIRQLRAVVASATRLGKFRLEGPDAEELAIKMQLAKGVDPSLALYAALAYRDQDKRDRIERMADFMRGDLGIGLFDIALLAGELSGDNTDEARQRTFPFLPLFSTTWSLLSVYGVKMPTGLKGIWRNVLPDSLWTMFNAEGVELISRSLQQGDVR